VTIICVLHVKCAACVLFSGPIFLLECDMKFDSVISRFVVPGVIFSVSQQIPYWYWMYY